MKKSWEIFKEGIWWLLLAYVLIIPFYKIFSSSFSSFRWTVVFLLTALVVWEAIKGRLSNFPLLLPMAAFVGAILLSFWHSVDPSMGVKYLKKDIFQMLAIFYGSYLLMSKRLGRIKSMVWTILLSSLLVLVAGLIHPRFKHGRYSATFQSPTKYGKFLDLVLPLAWSSLWLPIKWWTTLAVLLAAAETAALVFTATRSSMLAIPTMVGLQGIFIGHWRKLAVAVLLILLIMTGAFIGGGKKARRILYRFKGFSMAVVEKRKYMDASLETRLEIYRTAWALIKERPVFGWGYGRKIERSIVKKLGMDWYVKRGVYPFTFHTHSTILEVWLQCGLIGLLAYLWLMGAFWCNALKGWRGVRQLGEEYFALYLGFLGGLGALSLHSLITSILQLRHELLMMVFMASVMALVTRGKDEKSPQEP